MAKRSDFKHRRPTREDMKYVWDNMRDADKQECLISRDTRTLDGYIKVLENCDEVWLGEICGEPVGIWTAEVFGNFVHFSFCATKEADKHMIGISRIARAYVRNVLDYYWPAVGSLAVWDKYEKARNWVAWLGFYETTRCVETKYGKVITCVRVNR